MEKILDSIKWEDDNDFDIESLMNGPFAEIVALSKALDASFDFGRRNDIFCLAYTLRGKIA